MPMAETVK